MTMGHRFAPHLDNVCGVCPGTDTTGDSHRPPDIRGAPGPRPLSSTLRAASVQIGKMVPHTPGMFSLEGVRGPGIEPGEKGDHPRTLTGSETRNMIEVTETQWIGFQIFHPPIDHTALTMVTEHNVNVAQFNNIKVKIGDT